MNRKEAEETAAVKKMKEEEATKEELPMKDFEEDEEANLVEASAMLKLLKLLWMFPLKYLPKLQLLFQETT